MGFTFNTNTKDYSEADIPTAKGYWSPSPNGFVVAAKNGTKTCDKVLIATGAGLSTISKEAAENLGLEIKSASPLKIVYGFEPHTATTVSTSVATFVGTITGVRVCPVDIRVVEEHNPQPVVLGADWLKITKVGLNFNPPRIIDRQTMARMFGRPEPEIPSVQGFWTSSPSGFVVEAKIGSKTCKDIMIATGAAISTMDRIEAERLGLSIQNASPLRIVYGPPGHSVSTISNKVVKFTGSINNVEVPPVNIRLVESQSIKLILGMDWMEEAKIGLLFNPNRIYIQENEGLEELLRRTRS